MESSGKGFLDRGREDFVYRLSIGALPRITHIFPLGGRRGTEARVELYGFNLPAGTIAFPIPGDAPPLRRVAAGADALASNAMPFAAGDLKESLETEPNDVPAGAPQNLILQGTLRAGSESIVGVAPAIPIEVVPADGIQSDPSKR